MLVTIMFLQVTGENGMSLIEQDGQGESRSPWMGWTHSRALFTLCSSSSFTIMSHCPHPAPHSHNCQSS